MIIGLCQVSGRSRERNRPPSIENNRCRRFNVFKVDVSLYIVSALPLIYIGSATEKGVGTTGVAHREINTKDIPFRFEFAYLSFKRPGKKIESCW